MCIRDRKYFEAVGEVDLDPDLHIDILDRNWNRLMLAHQERDQTIQDEIKRFVVCLVTIVCIMCCLWMNIRVTYFNLNCI